MVPPRHRLFPGFGILFCALILPFGVCSGTVVAAGAPVQFRVALGSDPGDLDNPVLADGTHLPLALALADFLVSTDSDTGFPVPGLAEAWTVSPDRRTWKFTLRAARWSDGTILTAQDVADAWGRPSASEDPLGNRIESVSVLDVRHLEVVLRDPVPSPAIFACWAYAVVGNGVESRSPGPFQVESRVPGRLLTAVKNPRYREASSVRFDRLVFTFTDTRATAELLYRKGEVDWVPHGSGPGTAVDPGLRDAVAVPGWGTTFLRFNLTLTPGSDPFLRQTLAAALDRAALASDLRGPLSAPAVTLVPGAPASVSEQKKTKPFPLAGVAPFTILHASGETSRRLAQAVADQWSDRLGLTVDTKEMVYSDYLTDRHRGLYQVALSGWLGDYPDPLTFLEAFRSDSPANDTGWSDLGYDALVDKAANLPAGKARDQAVADAQALVLAAKPLVPLLSQVSVNQINLKRWKGWSANPTDRHPWAGFGPRK